MRLVSVMLIFLWLLPVKMSMAMDARELTIKAAYLFRLSLFVDWPAEKLTSSPSNKIRFCITSNNHATETIKDVLAGKTINQHEIEIVRVDLKSELRDCHLLYLTKNIKTETLFLQAVSTYPVLTVGETEKFYSQGGIILLFKRENRIFFAINNEAADRSRLKLGAQLLNLAEQYP